MIQDADLLLAISGLFVGWVIKDRQLTNSVVLCGDCTSFSIKSLRLMGADVPDLFLGPSRLGRADLTYSLRMMLVMEGTRKEKKGLEFIFYIFFNLVDLLKSLVAICVRRLYGLCAL